MIHPVLAGDQGLAGKGRVYLGKRKIVREAGKELELLRVPRVRFHIYEYEAPTSVIEGTGNVFTTIQEDGSGRTAIVAAGGNHVPASGHVVVDGVNTRGQSFGYLTIAGGGDAEGPLVAGQEVEFLLGNFAHIC